MCARMPEPSDDFLRRMYERSPVGFYRSTFDGRFVFVNPALVRMLRHERAEDVLALDLARDVYFEAADRARLLEQYKKMGTLDGLKVRWRTRGGEPLVVQLYGYLLPELDCIDVTVIDVTELDAAQTRIEQQRQELERGATAMRLLWKQLPGLVWTVDRELTITSADGGAISELGRTVDGELGRSLFEFYGTDRESYLPIRRHLEALEGRWVGFHQEVGGKQYAVTLGPHRAENGAIVGVVGVGIDVTTRYRLEQRMVDAQRAESLGVLAGGLAHDFNNLLVAILGNVSLGLREIDAGAPGHGVLENIRAAALDAAALTTQLLAYAGRGEISTTDVMLTPLLDEMLRLAAPQIPPNVRVTVEVPEELPPVRGDAAQLRQVVMNLLTNARDALGASGGSITLTASVVEHDGAVAEHDVLTPPSAGRFVALVVSDDGPGMDAATLRRIFDPFFSTKPNGHGLGLASVLGIVRSHGGGISVRSRIGHGASFQISWPMRRRRSARRSEQGGRRDDEGGVESAVVAAESAVAGGLVSTRSRHLVPHPGLAEPLVAGAGQGSEVSRPLPAGLGRSAIASRTVLVVDDEDAVRDVLVRLIEDLGYGVLSAADGLQALEVIEGATALDVVVIDLTLPGMSGAALVQEVRKRRPGLPIIVCSGHELDREWMPRAEGFLAKPFRIEALQSLLGALVGASIDATLEGTIDEAFGEGLDE